MNVENCVMILTAACNTYTQHVLKGGLDLWLKDIEVKLRERETLRKIQDLQLSYLTLEYLFRKLVSY